MRYAVGLVCVLIAFVVVVLLVPAASEIRLTKTVTSQKSMDEVFAYFSDFTSTNEWDPGTVKTELVHGDGGLGTQYRNITQFNGKQTELIYNVIDYRTNDRVQLRGENKTLVAVDTLTFRRTSAGTQFTYEAHFTFKGLAKLASPFLRGAFNTLGEEAEAGLRKVLA